MKTIFVAVNSQYIHTLLAPRYLSANAVGQDVEIYECNANMDMDKVTQDIMALKPDVIAFSCYIFNIVFVKRLLSNLRKVAPQCKIILGGYEVEYCVAEYLPLCDYIITGEGDFAFGQLLNAISEGVKLPTRVIDGGRVQILDEINSPYTAEYCALGKTKILYFESSRGCPFSCSYCMSANTLGVRTFSLERTFSDLKHIMTYSPKQIKFVDRTFNFDMSRATKIFEYIIDNFGETSTNFHFEMAPELFSAEMLQVLKKAKAGLFQFEIGVQSYNYNTLSVVGRRVNVEKVEENLRALVALNTIHIHVDLIAGLPQEDIQSFVAGFNRLYCIGAHCLQLGFLKVLKGSLMEKQSDGYEVGSTPPYEVLSSPMLTYNEILQLKEAEHMLERYKNSGRFVESIAFLLPKYFSPYEFFLGIARYTESVMKGKVVSSYYQSNLLYEYATKEVIIDSEDDYSSFCSALACAIASDYKNSGNARAWKKRV